MTHNILKQKNLSEVMNTEQIKKYEKNKKVNDKDMSLRFNSNFEGGNLNCVYKKKKYEYDLILNADSNTTSYSQWFYFSVKNTQKDQHYRFNIVNYVMDSKY